MEPADGSWTGGIGVSPPHPDSRWRPAALRQGESGRRDARGLGRESEFAIVGAYSVAAF